MKNLSKIQVPQPSADAALPNAMENDGAGHVFCGLIYAGVVIASFY